MGKIAPPALAASEVARALARREALGAPGGATGTTLARGEGWSVDDVLCTRGPADRPFEERHEQVSVALVLAGTFQYRGDHGEAMLTPGSIMLGSSGQRFECSHEHASGDRCVAFHYDEALFESILEGAGLSTRGAFSVGRLPPLPAFSGIVAAATCGATRLAAVGWEELALEVAARAARAVASGGNGAGETPPRPSRAALARITESVREIERDPAAARGLGELAARAGSSPYHYLRTFRRITGVTPHQFVLRARLRQAAARVATEPTRIIDIALDAGFADLSNFNRAFRAELGTSPRRLRVGGLRFGQGEPASPSGVTGGPAAPSKG
ncbi:MAG TPA: AraC family transcriptional regulator [Longimicrobiales bacterium]|nr:AraC family transcriptional regulator [Longimicrobiales bacterium]